MTNEPRMISRLALYGALVILCAYFWAGSVCFSQIASSVLNGTVTDATGAAIPNATITLTLSASGVTRTVRTSSAGSYIFPDLRPGIYSLSAKAASFKTEFIPHMTLYVGQSTTQDILLQVGSQTQQVTVSATSPLLNTTSGQLGTVITGTSITQLPLNGRNIMQLNLLSPGAVTDKSGNTSASVALDPASVSFSINGQPSDYNMYLLDGIEIKDWQHGTDMFNPSVDAIQEFQTTTSNYSAEFGSEAAAQINLVVKSGTNTLHGTAWEYLRNNVLDANAYFQPAGSKAPFKRNQFGGNIGGPVIISHIYNGKNKTFFFFNYEGFRQVKKVPETAFFPTSAQLQGNLSGLVTPEQPLINPFTQQPFPGNIIPKSMIRPATLPGFLANGIGTGPWIPAPNTDLSGANYVNNSPYNYNSNQYMTRIDDEISDKTSLYGHFAYHTEAQQSPNANPNWHITNYSDTYSTAAHIFHVITPNVTFNIDGGYTHFIQSVVQSTAFKNDITNKILGIAGNATIPDAWGAPVWNVTGYSNLGEVQTGPRLWFVNILDLRPAFTAVKGTHNLHFGMDLERVNEDFQEIFRTNGTWTYNGQFSGYSIADFLLGLPSTINSSPDPFSPDLLDWRLAPYFQDDWQLSPNLTVNLGLRYEWVGIPLSQNHRSLSNLYFPPNRGVPQIVVADNAGPINFRGVQATLFGGVPFVRASSVGLPEQLAFNDNTAFSPRIGFAYRIPGHSTTVVRGGYGVFYSADTLDNWIEAAIDPPFVRNNLTVVDSTNFSSFNPVKPYNYASSSAAQVFGNQINFRQGETQEWNLTVEHTIWSTLLSLGYVGNISAHMQNLADPNQAVPGPGSVVGRRKWPTVGVLYLAQDEASANYNGLQAKAQHRFSDGLEFLASYTWSKTMDTADGSFVGEGGSGFKTQNLLNPNSEYALAAQNVGQAFSFSYVYELPFGRGKQFVINGRFANAILGGWQINGVTSAVTGSPFTVSQTTNGANTDVGNYSPNWNGDPRLAHPSVAKFFNTEAFSVNVPIDGVYKFGSSRRNSVTGPGSVNSDFALYKNFKIKERGNVQFRTEIFNVFNHPIFAQPGAVLGSASFGTLTSTSHDNREIQLALRLSF